MFFTLQEIPELVEIEDLGCMFLCAFVLLLGMMISWMSTFFAVRKYLRMKTDNLYN